MHCDPDTALAHVFIVVPINLPAAAPSDQGISGCRDSSSRRIGASTPRRRSQAPASPRKRQVDCLGIVHTRNRQQSYGQAGCCRGWKEIRNRIGWSQKAYTASTSTGAANVRLQTLAVDYVNGTVDEAGDITLQADRTIDRHIRLGRIDHDVGVAVDAIIAAGPRIKSARRWRRRAQPQRALVRRSRSRISCVFIPQCHYHKKPCHHRNRNCRNRLYPIASSSPIIRSITERPMLQKAGSRASRPNGASSSA